MGHPRRPRTKGKLPSWGGVTSCTGTEVRERKKEKKGGGRNNRDEVMRKGGQHIQLPKRKSTKREIKEHRRKLVMQKLPTGGKTGGKLGGRDDQGKTKKTCWLSGQSPTKIQHHAKVSFGKVGLISSGGG